MDHPEPWQSHVLGSGGGGTVLAAEEVAAEEAGKGKWLCLRRPGSSGCQTGTRTRRGAALVVAMAAAALEGKGVIVALWR